MILKTLASKELEVRNRRGLWYRLKLMPYYTLNQSVGGVVITLVDITALKAANNRLNKLSAAAEQSLQLKVLIDLEGKIEYANPKVMEATGYALDELIGVPWDIVLADGNRSADESRLIWPRCGILPRVSRSSRRCVKRPLNWRPLTQNFFNKEDNYGILFLDCIVTSAAFSPDAGAAPEV